MIARGGHCGLSSILTVLAGFACGGRAPEAPRESPSSGLAWVPAGEFIFGCDANEVECPAHERPRRSMRLPAFQIAVYEVTEREYSACVAAGACVDAGPSDESQVPIQVYTIEEARAFCAWRGLRLPTSVEWEKAARGVDGRPFPWGSKAPDCELAAHCVRRVDHVFLRAVGDVGAHPGSRSPYGLQDMAGNAPEWTECPPDTRACVGVVRSPDHMGPDGLRTYAGYVAEGALFLTGAGFRCAT